MDSGDSAPAISKSKARLFGAILLLLLVAVPLLALELLVRGLGWHAPDDPYISFGRTTSFFEDFVEDGVAYKTVSHRDLYREKELTFAQKKPEGVFRVFCIGSSASAGWPHPDGEAYSDYLEQALYRAYPERKFEILNVSAHAYAAYRSRMIFEEVLAFEPDLFIVYAGNNEFIEQRQYAPHARWFDPIANLASRSTVYRLLRGSPPVARLFPMSTLDPEGRGGIAYEQWSKIEKLPLALRTEPDQYRKVREHYAYSVSWMVWAAKKRGVPVVLLTVPVNTRGWRPNVSVNMESADKEDWQKLYQTGRAALIKGESSRAVELLSAASEADPGHAATQYYLGRALEAAGRAGEAIARYDFARDLDANPFRAPSSLNDIIRRISRTFDNAWLVDADRLFREASAPQAPGFNLFLDYVHPTRKGNEILARAVFDTIVASGVLGAAKAPFRYEPEPGDNGEVYEAGKDQSLQRTLLILAMMMNQNETVVGLADRILKNPEGLGVFSEKEARTVTIARELFGKAAELERRELLDGNVTRIEQDELAASLKQLFQETFGNYDEYKQ